MLALYLYLISLQLMPARTPTQIANRYYLAQTIADAARDEDEARAMMLTAGYESGYADDVKACRRTGDGGKSLGLFQIKPIDRGDAKAACGGVEGQVALAAKMFERSAKACPGFEGPDRLSMYVSGRCIRGMPHSKRRWLGPDPARAFRPTKAEKAAPAVAEAAEEPAAERWRGISPLAGPGSPRAGAAGARRSGP